MSEWIQLVQPRIQLLIYLYRGTAARGGRYVERLMVKHSGKTSDLPTVVEPPNNNNVTYIAEIRTSRKCANYIRRQTEMFPVCSGRCTAIYVC